ncbi:hypothetical protein [Nocardioides mesophilus]|uniref:DUF4386 family protein n=1 Tax=Nocardioides mesophilus TaxID=433659 RepID=A0A7G9R7F6_9ACTN|nr:hypothetical protein [Nocardioides mesophilus]QNN51531.1 hypothetical protein H9L09_13175 [Nocardioides mesophilus]
MRQDLIPLSASALVVGAMCLVLGSALSPIDGGGTADTIRAVQEQGGRWLAMAVMYFCASVALTLGLPALLSVFVDRGRRLGALAVAVFSVGVLGTTGFAMLLVFYRALVESASISESSLDRAIGDLGLSVFLNGWVGSFYLGVLLLGIALLVARRTPRWSSLLLFAFVLGLPLGSALGKVGSVVQVMLLAVSFTAIAIAAVQQSQEKVVTSPARSHAY